MRYLLLLTLTLINAVILRFWMINSIPPLLEHSSISARVISAVFSIGNTVLLYFFCQSLVKSKKLALLAIWVFILLPWTIEQGRILSQVNNALFFILLSLLVMNKTNNYFIKIVIVSALFLVSYFIYPQFWIFKAKLELLPAGKYLDNFISLVSFDLIFFKNITFWWGGVKEVGIAYFSFLPFMVVGLYELINRLKLNLAILITIVFFISFTSPLFPESREFFLINPFISLVLAMGINKIYSHRGKISRLFFYLIFLFIIYDIAQFLHFYTVHYPLQIKINQSKINEAF